MVNETLNKIILLGSDHNGFYVKNAIVHFLKNNGFIPIDIGPHSLGVGEHDKVDYVDFAKSVAEIVNKEQVKKAILICGTGQGMAIVANKYNNVRAALAHNVEFAKKSREHNDSNILCLSSWENSIDLNIEIAKNWLCENYGKGRHVSRVKKISLVKPEKIVFANGCFDILHIGHIKLLEFAKTLGTKLIVGLNSDRSIKELKGKKRPINNELDRKAVLERLGCVDEVVIFDDKRPTALLFNVDVMVKGSDYTEQEVRKNDNVSNNIEIVIFQKYKNYSTTQLIKRINKS